MAKNNKDPQQQNNLAIGIGTGLPIGAALGLLVFDNLALGMGAGMAIGIAYALSHTPKK